MTLEIQKIKKERMYILLCFAFFLFTMVFNLMHSALWGDEWVEYWYSQASVRTGALYARIISTFQPPLYNVLMYIWLRISKSLLWFRSFNIYIGFASGVFLFLSLRKLYSEKVAAVSLIVLAACYHWVYCIQECSEYALMVFCLFGALYYYIACIEKFTCCRMVMFVLFAVAAMYSQYGAVFVVLPLLLLFYGGIVLSKQEPKSKKLWVTAAYGIAFVAFAVPLYWFFLRHQMANNEIADNTVGFTGQIVQDLPFTFGRIIGYMFNRDSGEVMQVCMSAVSVVMVTAMIFLIARKDLTWVKKSLIIALLGGYLLHYLLVSLHIYAMIHPGESRGFFSRYSYFYIPMFAVALPVLLLENKAIFVPGTAWKKTAVGIFAACFVAASFVDVLGNWHKALDDQFAKIWVENEGWNETTYLHGCVYGFYYYIPHTEGYNGSDLKNVTAAVDFENLPESFWVWRSNWGKDKWQKIVDAAVQQGYDVTVYADAGDVGQLAHCALKTEK